MLLERGATCRTPKAGSSTTPTPTSWRRRRGCATTPRPAFRDRICPSCATPSGNELRQTGDPDEQQRDLLASFERLRERHASDEYRADEADRDHAAQELRRHRRVHRRGPAPRARPARLLQPADLQHLPQPAAARPRARRRPRARLRGRPGPQPRDARVLLGRPSAAPDLLRAAGRLRTGRSRRPGTRSPWGAAALLVASGCPPAFSPSHIGPLPGVGPGRRGRHPGRLPRGRHRRPDRPQLLPATASLSRPTSTAARRTSGRSTTWGSPDPRPRRSPR